MAGIFFLIILAFLVSFVLSGRWGRTRYNRSRSLLEYIYLHYIEVISVRKESCGRKREI